MTIRTAPAPTENAQKLFEERYRIGDETFQSMLERASFGNDAYYEMMARLDFLPNSPTLFNAGRDYGTLSACFKFDVPDTMDGIMDVAKKAAMVLKYGGGVGYALSALRGAGEPVHSTHRIASGPVGFMPLYQAVANSITQGGLRRGAQMAILSCDHPDIEQFITCKDTPEKAAAFDTFNISVAATDEWMANVAVEPNRSLFMKVVDGAWRTGDPGLYFIDAANRANSTPWLGPLTGTNPCGEVPLYDNEACNLGSLNLPHFFVEGRSDFIDMIDWMSLEATVRLATRYLDEVIDHNRFPTDEITKAVALTRKLGLGVTGWADLLCLLNLPYDSDAAVEFAAEMSKVINAAAYDESVKLGKEKGPAPAYECAAPQDLIQVIPNGELPRNTTRTCIAPTGSISTLLGVGHSTGIEPHFSLEATRTTFTGMKLKERVSVLERSGGFVPKVSSEIGWEWHVKHQAAWQRNVDLAVSKTINMPSTATRDDIAGAYLLAHKLGCKGITVYRDGSRSGQVLVSDEPHDRFLDYQSGVGNFIDREHRSEPLRIAVQSSTTLLTPSTGANPAQTTTPLSERRKLPIEAPALRHKFQVGDQEGYLHVGLHDDGTPGEIFITCSKQGSTVSGLLDTWAITMSRLLQHRVPLEETCLKFIGTKFEPNGMTSNPAIPTATSIVDYIARYLLLKFGPESAVRVVTESGVLCPECGDRCVMAEGCTKCMNCGWSRC